MPEFEIGDTQRKQSAAFVRLSIQKVLLEIAWGAEYTDSMTQAIRWLQDEIADRMLQKLDIVKLDVKDILVVPDFPGKHLTALSKRFPQATIHSIVEDDLSLFQRWRNQLFTNWRSLFRGHSVSSVAEYLSSHKLNMPDHSVDLIFSDLFLQDLVDPKLFLQECWRVLREGGLIVFSYLGPDTAKELRSLNIPQLQLQNLVSPWDMHDMGDALISERFSDPVMDMEYLTLNYQKPSLLLADILALKLVNQKALIDLEKVEFTQKLTLEVVYGHAWAIGKHLSKAQDQVAYIDLNQIGRKTR